MGSGLRDRQPMGPMSGKRGCDAETAAVSQIADGRVQDTAQRNGRQAQKIRSPAIILVSCSCMPGMICYNDSSSVTDSALCVFEKHWRRRDKQLTNNSVTGRRWNNLGYPRKKDRIYGRKNTRTKTRLFVCIKAGLCCETFCGEIDALIYMLVRTLCCASLRREP